MDLNQRLQKHISKQEKYSIVLTIAVSLLYFLTYAILGGSHIISIVVLGILGVTIIVLVVFNTLQEFEVYSDEEETTEEQTTEKEDTDR